MCIRADSGVTDHLAENDAHALGDRAADRRQRWQPGQIAIELHLRAPARPRAYDPSELHGVMPVADPAPAVSTCASVIARIVDGSEPSMSSSAVRPDARHRLRAYPRHAGRASSPIMASCSARARRRGRTSSSCAAQRRHSAGVPAEHHRFHGGSQIRGGRHREGRGQDGDGGGDGERCRNSPSSSAAVSAPAITACAGAPTRRGFCGCGRTRASASWAARRRRACWRTLRRDNIEGQGRELVARRTKPRSARRSRRSTRRRATRITPAPGSGMTASSTQRTRGKRAGSGHFRRRPERAPIEPTRFGLFRM